MHFEGHPIDLRTKTNLKLLGSTLGAVGAVINHLSFSPIIRSLETFQEHILYIP